MHVAKVQLLGEPFGHSLRYDLKRAMEPRHRPQNPCEEVFMMIELLLKKISSRFFSEYVYFRDLIAHRNF